jgi:hypothetical protein
VKHTYAVCKQYCSNRVPISGVFSCTFLRRRLDYLKVHPEIGTLVDERWTKTFDVWNLIMIIVTVLTHSQDRKKEDKAANDRSIRWNEKSIENLALSFYFGRDSFQGDPSVYFSASSASFDKQSSLIFQWMEKESDTRWCLLLEDLPRCS